MTIQQALLIPWFQSARYATHSPLLTSSVTTAGGCVTTGLISSCQGEAYFMAEVGWWTLISPTIVHMHYSIAQEAFWLRKARKKNVIASLLASIRGDLQLITLFTYSPLSKHLSFVRKAPSSKSGCINQFDFSLNRRLRQLSSLKEGLYLVRKHIRAFNG